MKVCLVGLLAEHAINGSLCSSSTSRSPLAVIIYSNSLDRKAICFASKGGFD